MEGKASTLTFPPGWRQKSPRLPPQTEVVSHHLCLPFRSSLFSYLLLDVDLGQALQAGGVLGNGCKTQRTRPDDAWALPRDCSIVY